MAIWILVLLFECLDLYLVVPLVSLRLCCCGLLVECVIAALLQHDN